MADPRIYITDVELLAGAPLRLPDAAFRHLVQVLRLRAGDCFIAFDGRGGEFAAQLRDVGKREATATLGERITADRESPLDLTLAQCVSKGERMDYTLLPTSIPLDFALFQYMSMRDRRTRTR